MLRKEAFAASISKDQSPVSSDFSHEAKENLNLIFWGGVGIDGIQVIRISRGASGAPNCLDDFPHREFWELGFLLLRGVILVYIVFEKIAGYGISSVVGSLPDGGPLASYIFINIGRLDVVFALVRATGVSLDIDIYEAGKRSVVTSNAGIILFIDCCFGAFSFVLL